MNETTHKLETADIHDYSWASVPWHSGSRVAWNLESWLALSGGRCGHAGDTVSTRDAVWAEKEEPKEVEGGAGEFQSPHLFSKLLGGI